MEQYTDSFGFSLVSEANSLFLALVRIALVRKMQLVLVSLDKAIEFLDKNPRINYLYSFYYNNYFPEQKDVFRKSRLSTIEQKYKQCMRHALDKSNNFNMRYYFRCLRKLLPDYGIKELYVLFLMDDVKRNLIGACTWSIGTNGMDTTLSDLFVSHLHRKKGYSKVLTNCIIRSAKNLSQKSNINNILLTVDVKNTVAIKTYKGCGFTPIMSFDPTKYKMEYPVSPFN